MNIIFSKSDYVLSKAIRFLTGEPVSHVAIEIADTVIQSNLYGVGIETLEEFRVHSDVLYAVEIPDDFPRVMTFLAKLDRSLYDYGALFFWGIALVLHKYLRLPIPKVNLWHASGMYLCTELVTEYLEGEEDATTTPYQLYLRMKNGAPPVHTAPSERLQP